MTRLAPRLAALLALLSLAMLVRDVHAQAPVPLAPVPRPLPAVRDTAAPTPPIDSLFDLAALRARLGALPAAPDTGFLRRLFRMHWDTAGRPLAPVAVQPVTGEWRDSVVAALRATRRTIGPRNAPLQVHLEVRTGPEADAALHALEIADVRLSDPRRLQRQLQGAVQEILRDDDALLGRELTARVRLAVGPDGLPSDLVLVAPSGHARIDEAALQLVRQSLFVPMRVNGIAVKSLAVLPLRFVFPDG